MRPDSFSCLRFLFAIVALPLAASAIPGAPRPILTPRVEVASDVVVPWGSGADRLGLRPTSLDFPGEAVSAVAVAPDGDAWLLDRVNRRAVKVSPQGRFVRTIELPAEAEDLAVGPDGTLAAYSPFRARVWLFDEDGPAGEIAVPRELDEVVAISLGASRQVRVTTGYQETFTLGSPGAVQTTASLLAMGREGAAELPDGAGLQVRRRDDGRAELLVVEKRDRSYTRARWPFGRQLLGARVVGAAGDVACVRTETEVSATPLKVGRRLVCLDARTGSVTLDEELPAAGLVPTRRELAMGGTPARAVFVRAEAGGLRIRSRLVATGGAR